MTIDHSSYLPLVAIALIFTFSSAKGVIVILRNDFTVSVESWEATFAPQVGRYGVSGYIVPGVPLDACSALVVKPHPSTVATLCPFVLVSGSNNCSLGTKIKNAQDAGFAGIIISFDQDDDGDAHTIVSHSIMNGETPGEEVQIYVIFVTRSSGMILRRYGVADAEIWILPGMNDSIWPVIITTVFSFFVITAMSFACFIGRRNNLENDARDSEAAYHALRLKIEEVRAMPMLKFTGFSDENSMSEDTCGVCLEDYVHGDQLRVLPCCHRFHTSCIDVWLTMWKPSCPLCRRNPRSLTSETTPLLGPPPQPTATSTSTMQHVQASTNSAHLAHSSHSLAMQIPNSANSQFQHMGTLANPSQMLVNASPIFTSLHISEHTPVHSRSVTQNRASMLSNADPSLEAFRASPHFMSASPHYLNIYESPSTMH